ncbi:MAG: penicillin-binding protein 2 [Nitrospirae bacterium GWF2_44_13]|nr:MAG: penicillin-binding protein 2 [Nitrospirae bacterium GWF2_44_13]OGW34377.1 MAG: penicillin-binding protein 2 [Nitrospirae bacterium GWD2_44_7]OGW63701.1 MAG: penicillin-binding protein 2 [Nitrospirae bacterium RIFOXYA2_FULL_44_9]HBG92909.1 penicillin-binding protein 2 [Nitrospiraceae bacterium]HBU05750.1 penicillin-binding protein 2 [Nitrospiraceae bacterium]
MSNNSRNRILLASYVIAGLFALFAIRLWQLQVLQGKEYGKISMGNMLRIIKIPAPRGIIYDRNGVPLVKNSPYFYASLMPENLKQVNIQYLANILGINAGDIYARINKKGLSPFEPIKLKEGLTFKEIAAMEARRSDFPGLIIDIDMSREYLYGDIGAHLIGYLGKLNPSQSKNPEFKDVPPEAFIGQWGAELLFDRTLRGIPGERIIEIDALGREIKLLKENPPVKGADLKLSIDINLQKAAEEAFAGRAGAVVALKPDTGEILGLVSRPSFDPNLFARGVNYSQWTALLQDKKMPMLNRALQSQYPPGSTFKIVTAIAALNEGVITPDTKVTCTGGITYGKWQFGCWKKGGHGTVSLHRAIVESCDVYFYEVGKRLGIDKIAEYARRLGLGSETGLQLVKERSGLIPDTKWKHEKKNQQWYLGETFNAAIGQGYVAATPMQMAQLMSVVANGGIIYRPMMVKAEAPLQPVASADIKPQVLDLVRNALYGVVNEGGGTGGAAKSSIATVGGKTGTAQVVSIRKSSHNLPEKHRDHAWFVAFAPVEKSAIALCVFIEHGGHGGGAAAPIAKLAIEAYLKSEKLKAKN